MTVRQFIRCHPYVEENWKKQSEYCRWLASKFKEELNEEVSPNTVRQKLWSERTSHMRITRQTYDGDGNLKGEVKALKYIPQADTDGMQLKKVSVSNFGLEWKQYHSDEINYAPLIDAAIEKHYTIEKKIYPRADKYEAKACLGIITDAHIGLCAKGGLFEYEWNEDRLVAALADFFNSLVANKELHGRFEELHIYSLGDMLDGYNGETVRGGHALDQNMDNATAFNVYVNAKLDLIENILDADLADKIVIRNVVNDNHSGSYGEIAEICIKKVL